MLTIDVKDNGLRDYLQQLAGRLDDMSQPMREIGGVLETRASARFQTHSVAVHRIRNPQPDAGEHVQQEQRNYLDCHVRQHAGKDLA